jgi:hypothetical protein
VWCPSCGDEFRTGYTRCEECEVALVAERPAHPTLVRRVRWLDDAVTFDLSAWPDGRRRALDAWVFADNIPSEWELDGSTLTVPARRATDVEDLIAMLDADADEEATTADSATEPPARSSPTAE